jgi:hypothetical protein
LQRIAQILSGQSTLSTSSLSKLATLDDLYALITDNAAADAIAFDQIHLDLIAAVAVPSATLRLPSAAGSTNATAGAIGACRLFNIQGMNAATTTRYLKLYDLARAPVVGTDAPAKTLALPPSSSFAFDWANPYQFKRGLSFALTTGAADSDTAALTSADVVGLNIDYA